MTEEMMESILGHAKGMARNGHGSDACVLICNVLAELVKRTQGEAIGRLLHRTHTDGKNLCNDSWKGSTTTRDSDVTCPACLAKMNPPASGEEKRCTCGYTGTSTERLDHEGWCERAAGEIYYAVQYQFHKKAFKQWLKEQRESFTEREV